ncbi:hypothetical protein C9374_012581 [Naegleria lovaniensis]|uniref:Uncharacterized protein n=1 Tax=Naegleria lovaniensis TaxID=51637 RepID=A0AA88H295_NAELO|nr:uncharacterized protein C9374_012581 [Naegleria lovaniensis]KAG2392329.1 hypothetical protein C9374_012581 [Naegleria lovaniensis]
MIGAFLVYISNLLCVLLGLVYPLIASYHTARQFIQKQEEYDIVIKFQKLQEKKRKEGLPSSSVALGFNTPERQEQLWKEEQLEILESHHKKWLAYWMIYTVIYVFEFLFEDFFYNRIPFYYVLKLVFLFFVITTKGLCVWFYDNCVYRLMKWENLEQDIDKVLAFARTKLYSHVFKYFEGGKDVGLSLWASAQANVLPFALSLVSGGGSSTQNSNTENVTQ